MTQEPIVADRAPRLLVYWYAFFMTLFVFASAYYISTYFNSRRIQDIRSTQDNISTDILSLETQFDLLQQRSCDSVSGDVINVKGGIATKGKIGLSDTKPNGKIQIRYDKDGNAFTKDEDGNVIPYTPK